MSETPENPSLEPESPELHLLLQEQRHDELRAAFDDLHTAEIALFLESLPPDERIEAWQLIPSELDGEVLTYVSDHVRPALIEEMDHAELVAAAEGMETDDLADLLPEMPEEVIAQILAALDEQNRQRLEAVLSYPEDTAGGLMNVDAVTVRATITLDVVLRYLRRRGTLPNTTDHLMVVDRDNTFLGMLALTDLVTHPGSTTVEELLSDDIEPISAATPTNEVAKIFERRDLVTAPVVDENGKLLGRITIDDVVDVIRDEADHSFMGRSGLSEEEDLFAPVLPSTKRRAVWLGANLLTAFLASWVIGLFDATISQLVALAVLMPIVASMGGIAGSQTLTLVIRALALDQVNNKNARQLMKKEVAVGLLNGLIWATVIAGVVIVWFGNAKLGLVIASAIIINLCVAALSGATIPLMLRRLGADPALAGSVVLTTVTDVVGFFAFLGLASLFLI